MLTELRISNFAVIDRLALEFSTGFHVLTGETGAGKSIIVDAIALLVGARGSADQIRSGVAEAVIEAAFVLPPDSSIVRRLREQGLMVDDHGEIVVRRMLSRTGRHRAYINGLLTPVHMLQQLAGTLIDIHGQHEQQSLLSSQAQLEALDAFGGLHALREEYAAQHARWLASRRELEESRRITDDRRAREDLLRYQYRELDEADLRPGEEDHLTAEYQRLAHARRLAELEREAYDCLYASDTSVLSGLGAVGHRLRALNAIDAETGEWTTLCEGAAALLDELAQRLRLYREHLNQDPERLTQIEDRLDRLRRLGKKYGADAETLWKRAADLKRQLEELDGTEARTAELGALVEAEFQRLDELGRKLSARRRAVAEKMQVQVEAELAGLRMEQSRVEIAIRSDQHGSGGPTGRDHVEYLISANQGEPLQPLARVVSGGELSRVMLAVKTVLAQTDRVPVLIFDEVDAGIGGAVAAVVGRRLRALSQYHQVFCITHLPQIASQTHAHWLVRKTLTKKRAATRVTHLDERGKQEEIARMLGGLSITKAVRDTAAEMIEAAGPRCER